MKLPINFSSQSIPRRNTRKFSSILIPIDSQSIIHEISHQFLTSTDSQTKYTKILISFSSQSIPRRNTRNFSSISHPNRFPDEIREISHQFLIQIDSQS